MRRAQAGRAVWRAAIALCWLACATPLAAQCRGENLLHALPVAEFTALQARAAEVPFPRGNFWHATRTGPAGSEAIYLIGTYHLPDPRHAATLAALAPVITAQTTLLVEAGPAELEAIRHLIGTNPGRVLDLTGPTLPEQLGADDWKRLVKALQARGIPPFLAAKFRPWYMSSLLGMPTCGRDPQTPSGGLDDQIIALAQDLGLPVRGLEPFDRVLDAFDQLPRADQLSMVTTALAMETAGKDMAVTVADAYFDGENRLVWEFLRHESLERPGSSADRVNREFATMEAALMSRRNLEWIPVITAAAAEGPVLAAFGALHLSGDEGVLALLQAEGFVLHPLALN